MKLFMVVMTIAGFMTAGSTAVAQEFKWMNAGSLQNWFSSMGCEEEEGFVKEQQYGLQWPAIYNSNGKLVDMQAAKGLWIAYDGYTYADGTVAPLIVHIGPRVHGYNEMYPVGFKLYSKEAIPEVYVDGNPTEGKSIGEYTVDPSIPADRMLVNIVNTFGGITMTRKIMQFSQPYHDNYMVYDYEFKNTGNTSTNDTTVLASAKPLTGVYFYFQYRYAVCADTRYVIGQNPTGWGINEMNDFRGDGSTYSDKFFTDNTTNGINYNIRAGYSWHGKYPPFTLYNNIGGPIWTPYYDKIDTVGRLGAAQFVGVVTIHADKSAVDKSDDSNQPSTTDYVGSDEPNTSNNDRVNPVKNTSEYGWITKGHVYPSHADKIGENGDPANGTPGGYSIALGYGPYTLAPGQSIHIVQAEAAAGLDRDAAVEIGKAFKASGGNVNALIPYKNESKTKNDWVYTGRDSLFQTFNRAIANYQSGFAIPEPPSAPTSFTVNSGGDKIFLSWDVANPNDPNLKGFEIYRALTRYDSTYHLIYSASASERTYQDVTAQRGLEYYYYIVSVGDPALNTGGGNTPPGVALRSNRYLTQTYDPAYLLRQPVYNGSEIRIVPNPYNINSGIAVAFSPDRLGFLNIPGVCTIKIYTELGELVATLNHTNGSGDEYWDSRTSSGQIIVSGLYIAVIEGAGIERTIKKFVVIR